MKSNQIVRFPLFLLGMYAFCTIIIPLVFNIFSSDMGYTLRDYNQDMSKVYRDIGIFSQKRNDLTSAIKAYTNALEKNPCYVECYDYLGTCFELCKQFDQAIQTYLKAVSLSPDFIQMRTKKNKTIPSPDPIKQPDLEGRPLWQGEALENCTLLVKTYGNQSDIIFFSRFLSVIASKAKKIIFIAPTEFHTLFTQSFGATISVIPEGTPLQNISFDYYTWLHTIPNHLNISYKKIPARNGYLTVDPIKTKQLHPVLHTSTINIGIAWPQHQNNTSKGNSVALQNFLALNHIPNIKLYLLNTPEEQDNIVLQKYPRLFHSCNQYHQSLEEKAALMKKLDLIITADTMLAHLGGALGVKTWVLLPYVSDWHWLGYSEGAESCWYTHVKKIRQPRKNDWKSVFAKVSQEVRHIKKRHAC